MKKCWAHKSGLCGDMITGEHLISKSILAKKTIMVQGFSWCKNEPKEIGVAGLVNNFLCNHHNSCLSLCDTEIANFVSAIENFTRMEQKFSRHGFSLKHVPVVFRINGLVLEKWFIKTLINISLTKDKDALIHFDKVLPILFSNQICEKPYGVNFAVKVGDPLKIRDEIMISPFFNETSNAKELAGGIFLIKGYKIIILLPCSKHPISENRLELHPNHTDFHDLQLNWHNSEISMDMKSGRKAVKVLSMLINW